MVPLKSTGTNRVSSFMSYQGMLSKPLNVSATSFKGVFNDVRDRGEINCLWGCALAEQWSPLAPNFCSWPTRVLVFPYKSYAGQPRIYSFRALGSLQFYLEHSRYEWSPKKLCVCCLLSFCNIRKIWQPLDLNNAIVKWWLQPLCNGISNQNSNLQ